MTCKQNLVKKSSTEPELVRVDDAMIFALWAQHFFQEQAKILSENSKLKEFGVNYIIEQDDTNTIQLKWKGKRSSNRRTQHINIRYFYVTVLLYVQDLHTIRTVLVSSKVPIPSFILVSSSFVPSLFPLGF